MKFFFKKMLGVYILRYRERSQWRGRVKIWGEGGGMNWQEVRTDGKYEAEPVGLVSERRPIVLADGNLCPWQGWTPRRYLETNV